jgi:predicted enzyme related to lactoylglutathione lyase
MWHELLTSDPGAAATFYADVVGWKTGPYYPSGT